MTRSLVRIALVGLAAAALSSDGAAQSEICDTVKLGDTASAVSERLTGSRDSLKQPWFRVIDPTRSKVIPKGAYDRILEGWQVCIPEARRGPEPSPASLTDTSRSQSAQQLMTGAPIELPDALKLALVLLGPAVFGAAIGFAWNRIERFLTVRRALKREVEYFGGLFVKDFERPLVIDGVVSHPIRSRLRWVSFNRRLEILLAPAAGRRYPNLDDHRRNVEYDVDRIAHRLRHHSMVRKPLRSEGEWVVVPFQLKPRP